MDEQIRKTAIAPDISLNLSERDSPARIAISLRIGAHHGYDDETRSAANATFRGNGFG